ncbi:MAG: hypothetical protein CVV27_13210 [Candidatus Melainabacteria bacterium HGW-Melainabacteria-1]|nr:MAG: hypothetical protein CVV27_13210 [Candidatus Melainabacteria bacterium HGW-Melainabacteria-1]
MATNNRLTQLQREILNPVIGKIATGFRLEASPNRKLFTDKFTIRLRLLDQQDSELFLGIHYKLYAETRIALNLGINLMTTEGIEHQSLLAGFAREEQGSLQTFLRQPLTGFHLSKEQSLTLFFAHQSLMFEVDREEDTGELNLGWAMG